MKFYLTASLGLLAGLVTASPTNNAIALPKRDNPDIKIVSVSAFGSGCPNGTYQSHIDPAGEFFEVDFSSFITQSGPGTHPSDWRKECQITVDMSFTQGLTFSVMDIEAIGYAQLPDSSSYVKLSEDVSFVGQPPPHPHWEQSKVGPLAFGELDLVTHPDIITWSTCGKASALLDIKTTLALWPPNKVSVAGVDEVDGAVTEEGHFKIHCHLNWKHC